ncbi:hypothetical protein UPYG_G00053970, partial [Umbra pygmaea]
LKASLHNSRSSNKNTPPRSRAPQLGELGIGGPRCRVVSWGILKLGLYSVVPGMVSLKDCSVGRAVLPRACGGGYPGDL